ncbi:OmpA family protein [Flammeovirga agarivorans]|uniref:OmpA family protein n=1 Tax=Flammeovirga agarivorans TaxID=2726742 RepID=A0A7X8XW26_9BACT|nr:OmpA family protein [Flammeovirga agarivorans]NLR91908.1 OmpA family protein [Flammeovirga agarivorans]
MSSLFKIVLSFTLCWLLPMSLQAQFAQVFFHKNQHQLNYKARTVLDNIISKSKESGACRELTLYGFTDQDASFEHNKKLALQRSMSVYHYLLEADAPFIYNFVTIGEDDIEKVPDHIKDKEAYMRRVDLKFKRSHYDRTFTKQDFPKEEFLIDLTRDTTIVGQQGTILNIPAYSFALTENKEVKIVLREAYTASSFIKNKLTSETNDGGLLSSKGMIHVEAYKEGEKVDLAPYKYISVKFKGKKDGDGMSLYYPKKVRDEMLWENEQDFSSQYLANNMYFSWRSYAYYETYEPVKDTISLSHEIDTLIDGKKYVYTRIYKPRENINYTSLTEMSMDVPAVDNYFNAFSLGWLNCDRLNGFSENQVTELYVDIKSDDQAPKAVLYFPKLNAITSSHYHIDGKAYFYQIPKNEEAYLVSYFSRNGENILFGSRKINTSTENIQLTLQRITPYTLNRELEKLDQSIRQ